MRRTVLLWLIAAAFVNGHFAQASDVWAIQGQAIGPSVGNTCYMYQWMGDLLFHNTTPRAQTITVVDVSNGPLPATGDRSLVVPSGATVSSARRGKLWFPLPTTSNPLWVTHLDIPDGVVMESRIEIGQTRCAFGEVPNPSPIYGKLSFPVYRSLQPAGVPKFHIGTDLGSIDARNNVAVFNAGTSLANVHIDLRQGCDDAVIDTLDVVLAANTTQQFSLRNVQTNCGESATNTRPWVTYVVVTVDQPSVSFVSSLSNTLPLNVPYGVTFSSQ